LDYSHTTNMFTCAGMFVAMATVDASTKLAEFSHKWNIFYSSLSGWKSLSKLGWHLRVTLKIIFFTRIKAVPNVNNISIAVLHSVFTVHFGRDICRYIVKAELQLTVTWLERVRRKFHCGCNGSIFMWFAWNINRGMTTARTWTWRKKNTTKVERDRPWTDFERIKLRRTS
jgi:hypothetical protein